MPSLGARHGRVLPAGGRPRAPAPNVVAMTAARDVLDAPRLRSEQEAARIQRAKGYPYIRPDSSFVFINGEAISFPDAAWPDCSSLSRLVLPLDGSSFSISDVLERRGLHIDYALDTSIYKPVLAIGSNAAPEQLARKFPPNYGGQAVVIAVVRCVLAGFDVVYAPLISSYGSCTATLEHSPGTCAEVYVTFLTPPLLARMHETEGAYNCCKLTRINLQVGQSLAGSAASVPPAGRLTQVLQYNHQQGSLYMPLAGVAPMPIALKEIPAAGRAFPALTQSHMQQALRRFATLNGLVGGRQRPDGAAPSPPSHAPGHMASASVAAAQEAEAAPSTTEAGSAFEAVGVVEGADGTLVPALDSIVAGRPRPLDLRWSDGEARADWLWRDEEDDLDDWILGNLRDPAHRAALVTLLTAAARPFAYAECETLQTLGSVYDQSVA